MIPIALTIDRTGPHHPDALAMVGESEAELASIYRPEVRHAFSPDQLAAAGVHFLVAREDGRPVGCGGLAPCEGYGELKRIFVTRGRRGAGIARRIVEALEAEARALGLGIVRLETGELSPEALGLYASMGYRRRGPFGAYLENGSSVFMEKRLD
ncbi:GNAT family N-acetyltransferase [Limibaculum sp. FT325]|uniref:GNAT family N-acetyltransferase n=1 Tax=Thermohalobaculum sediminis TaxID=2939436 RepID=UPI0020C186E5|nr:GNAT family N-acetyltransferase [Limibaculum sediminis]MCL5775624.1 GNAT family N-acetyltransferase [Limibaculum sediminis]